MPCSDYRQKRYKPLAPASSRASACVSPSPRAPPEISTTLSTRLNSGRRLSDPSEPFSLLSDVFPEALGVGTGVPSVFEEDDICLATSKALNGCGLRGANTPHCWRRLRAKFEVIRKLEFMVIVLLEGGGRGCWWKRVGVWACLFMSEGGRREDD